MFKFTRNLILLIFMSTTCHAESCIECINDIKFNLHQPTCDVLNIIIMLFVAIIWRRETTDLVLPLYIMSDICASYNTCVSHMLFIMSIFSFVLYIGLICTVITYYIRRPNEAYACIIIALAKYGANKDTKID